MSPGLDKTETVPKGYGFSTDRRAAQPAQPTMQQLAIFDAGPCPSYVIDEESGRFLAVNEAALRCYGYTRAKFLALMPVQIRPQEDVPYFRRAWRLPGTGPFVTRHRTAAGAVFDVEVFVARVTFLGRRARVIVASDVTKRVQAEEELRRSHEQLRLLSARTRSLLEEERTRIARELHDQLGQSLSGLKMDLAWLSDLSERSEPSTVRATIAGMMGRIDGTIRAVRRLSAELRPRALDQLGLVAAVCCQAREFARVTGVKCRVVSSGDQVALDRTQSTALFRIFQEVMSNISRHAGATRVVIAIKQARDHVLFSVRDNGRGISQAAVESDQSLGIIGMRERTALLGGTLTLGRGLSKGTVVIVTIPLAPQPRPEGDNHHVGRAGE